MLFGRVIPTEELVEKIESITVSGIRDLATRILTGSKPTLAAVGALGGMMGHAEVSRRFGVKLDA